MDAGNVTAIIIALVGGGVFQFLGRGLMRGYQVMQGRRQTASQYEHRIKMLREALWETRIIAIRAGVDADELPGDPEQ